MSEYPYWKFYARDYLGGNIQGASLEVQGFFINLCALMWINGGSIPDKPEKWAARCKVTEEQYRAYVDHLENDLECLKRTHVEHMLPDVQFLTTNFIQEQLAELANVHEKRSKAGKISGQKRKKDNKKEHMFNTCSTNGEQNPTILDVRIQNLNTNTPIPPSQGVLGMGELPKPPKKKRLSQTEKQRIKIAANTPLMIRIGKWFGRQEKTLWSLSEAEALQQLGEISEADLVLLEFYYMAEIPQEDNIRRRDLPTLFNHWSGELDRARNFRNGNKPPLTPEQIRQKKVAAAL